MALPKRHYRDILTNGKHINDTENKNERRNGTVFCVVGVGGTDGDCVSMLKVGNGNIKTLNLPMKYLVLVYDREPEALVDSNF